MTTRLPSLLSLLLFTGLLSSCHKDKIPPENGTVSFEIGHQVDGASLEFDTMKYANEAGNTYSVTKLHYYISDITFNRADKGSYTDHGVHYVDARDGTTHHIQLEEVPIGEYTGISFLIGLNSDTNRTGTLPAMLEHINMAWPDIMGGGYHFMKLEGHFKDSSSTAGYAMHIGTDPCLVNINIDQAIRVMYRTPDMKLNMNINEWFSNPVKYDLSTGNYTMGIADKMLEIATNGTDVFTLDK